MPRALISVSDKRGIVAFAQGLVAARLGDRLDRRHRRGPPRRRRRGHHGRRGHRLSRDARRPGQDAAPRGARRAPRAARHRRRTWPRSQEHGIVPIDLVAVNLYPFQRRSPSPASPFEDAIENIDIGGPSMLRSAAKNHEFVLPVVDPTDYPKVLDLLRRDAAHAGRCGASSPPRSSRTPPTTTPPSRGTSPRARTGCPRRLGLAMERTQTLRYGENPAPAGRALRDRGAARHARPRPSARARSSPSTTCSTSTRRCAAVACWSNRPACASSSTRRRAASPSAARRVEAFRKARATDPVSAFGSVIAFNTVVDRATAAGDERPLRRGRRGALASTTTRWPCSPRRRTSASSSCPVSRGTGSLDFKRVRGGFLVQEQFQFDPSEHDWTVATDRAADRARSGTTSASPGPRSRRSSRTRSCWPATRRRSASAPAR